MQWFYSKDGTQLGPVEQSELEAKLATGEVEANALVWREGLPDWLPASQVAELAGGGSGGGQPGSALYGGDAAAAPARYSGPPIPNYLWQSIVVTILCCWPFGIPAIIFAAKVDRLMSQGDVQAAQAASAAAKKWATIAFVAGLVVLGIYIALMAMGALTIPTEGY